MGKVEPKSRKALYLLLGLPKQKEIPPLLQKCLGLTLTIVSVRCSAIGFATPCRPLQSLSRSLWTRVEVRTILMNDRVGHQCICPTSMATTFDVVCCTFCAKAFALQTARIIISFFIFLITSKKCLFVKPRIDADDDPCACKLQYPIA
jgi:hypothetical protein